MQASAIGVVDKLRLDGQVSIVTGASRGIGLALAEGLAGAGSDLVVVGRKLETLQHVAERIGAEGGRQVLPIQADIGNLDQIDTLVEKTVNEFGKINILINNAGINAREPAVTYSESDWDAVTDVNLKGTFFLTQACGKVMVEQNAGKVINILSLTSAIGLPTVVAYTAAKGGLTQLTKLLAVEWAPHNIQVNGIAPGVYQNRTHRPCAFRQPKRMGTKSYPRLSLGRACRLGWISDIPRFCGFQFCHRTDGLCRWWFYGR